MDFGSGKIDMGLYYQTAATWNADAMLSGSNTILSSIPPEITETADTFTPPDSYHPGAVPLMVIVDSRGRIRNWNYLRSQPFWRKIVVLCSHSTLPAYLKLLEEHEVEHIVTGQDHVDYRAALEALNERYDVRIIRLDSGGILNGVLLRAGLIQEVSLLIDPCVVGGTSPRSFFTAADLISGADVISLRPISFKQLPNDVLWVRYEVAHS
jgi:2,5-diamino-6-(ribosylamino)-4(3H)-pyrimidinone 5'-phosphate reductase